MLTKITFFLFVVIIDRCLGYPGGAPLGSCESLSPEAGHGVPSQNVADAPFSVVATTNKYNNGDKIGVEIFQREKGANFRGFLVQALDASTHSPVGAFLPAQGMKPMSECSSVTHSDSRPKKAVNLVWQAPSNHAGQVIFRATIVQRKQLYYANILAFDAEQFYSPEE